MSRTYTITPILTYFGIKNGSSINGDKTLSFATTEFTDSDDLIIGAASSYKDGFACRASWDQNDANIKHLINLGNSKHITSIYITILTERVTGNTPFKYYLGPLANNTNAVILNPSSIGTIEQETRDGITNFDILSRIGTSFPQYGIGFGGTSGSIYKLKITQCTVTITTDEWEDNASYYVYGTGVYTGKVYSQSTITQKRIRETDSYGATGYMAATKEVAISRARKAVKNKLDTLSFGNYGNWNSYNYSDVRIGNYMDYSYNITASASRPNPLSDYTGSARGTKEQNDYQIMQEYRLEDYLLQSTVETAKIKLKFNTVSIGSSNSYYICCKNNANSVIIPGNTSWCGAYVSFTVTSAYQGTEQEIEINTILNYIINHNLDTIYIMQGWAMRTDQTSVGNTGYLIIDEDITITAGLNTPILLKGIGYLYYDTGTQLLEATPYYCDGTKLIKASF